MTAETERAAGSIDFHAHIVPERIWTEAQTADNRLGLAVSTDDGIERLQITPTVVGRPSTEQHFSIDERLAAMDASDVGVQVASLSPLLFRYDLERGYARDLARDINDELAGLVAAMPDRFRALANLPLPDVDDAIAELQRAVGGLGLSGVELDTHVGGRGWDEPDFDRFFAAADELGAVLFFHPSYSLVWKLSPRYHLGNTVGNPAEDTLACAALISGGILERYRNLTCVVAHGGGPITLGIGRMDHGWKVRPEARDNIRKPPSRYLDQLYFDSITWSEGALRLLIDTVGVDKIVMGSDWPYDMGPENPTAWVADMERVTDEEKQAILVGNAARLLRL